MDRRKCRPAAENAMPEDAPAPMPRALDALLRFPVRPPPDVIADAVLGLKWDHCFDRTCGNRWTGVVPIQIYCIFLGWV